jgi:sodium transport system permease protein
MIGPEIGIVWRKELLDILRDRRTIMAMIVVPLLVYPIMIIVISQLGIAQVERIRASLARITVLPEDASPDLFRAFAADSTFTVVFTEDPERGLEERTIDAVIRLPHDFENLLADMDSAIVSVKIDLSRDRGEQMRDRIRTFLFDWRKEMVAERLANRELPDTFVKPFLVEIDNVAGDRKMGGSLIGRILPFFLVVMMISGALYPAIDVTAGERERGTLETLLVVPASRLNIVIGKFLTVFVASMVTTLANIASIAFTVFFLIGNAKMGGDFAANIPGLLDWRAFFLIFLIMIPMGILFSGLAMLVASFARSFKEAQNYLSPLMIACMAPAYLSFLPGVEINQTWALVPIANVVLLSRELLLGNYAWGYFFITVGTMSALAFLLLNRTVRLFGHEAMLGGGEAAPKFSFRSLVRRDPHRKQEQLSPGLVAQIFILVLLGFFYLGTPLQLQDTRGGLVLTQLLVIAGIPILALRFWGLPVGRVLGLRRIPRPGVMALVLIGAPAATMLAALVGMAQGTFMEVPQSYQELMKRLFESQGGTGLLTAILVFAVIPGFCEEILFRGFVLRGLATRMNSLNAVFWTAVLFGAFHFDLYRLMPTITLGFVLGLLVWVTGSLWPAILLHITNNTIAVLATNRDVVAAVPWLDEGAEIPLQIVLMVGALGVTCAVGIIRMNRRPKPLSEIDIGSPVVSENRTGAAHLKPPSDSST